MPAIFALLLIAACGTAVDRSTDDRPTEAPSRSQAQAVADPRPANAPDQRPAFEGQTDAPLRETNVAFDVVTVAEGLERPWAIEFLPSGHMLVTERPGRLRIVTPEGAVSPAVTGLPEVDARGQGGLLDVALDPDFPSNRLIYWSYAELRDEGRNNTAVARGRLVDDMTAPRVENVEVIYHQRPTVDSRAHFGSRLVFGRDGTLFITQGDRASDAGRDLVQQMDTTVGKVVRINPDGSIPDDNPFVDRKSVV